MPRASSLYCACVLVLGCSYQVIAQAQQIPQSAIPDSPDTVSQIMGAAYSQSQDSSSSRPFTTQQGNTSPLPMDEQTPQTKRILGIIPNFRAVSTSQVLPPQSAKEKFITATEDSFDYSAFVLPAVLAGYSMATRATPEFRQGAAGYGRYFWHSWVDQSSENYAVEFIVPTLTHEDIRYYTLGKGGFFKRTGYALSRAVVTRSDSGTATFNIGEVVGAGASAGISNLYYPASERTFGNTAQKWGLNVGIDAGTFVFKEFWPDINHAIFHTKD
jgi:hypothetical protein